MHHLAGVAIHANRELLLAILGGGGHPDLLIPDDGRGPAEIVNRRFPNDVVGFAPGERQLLGQRVTVAVGAPELRPVVAGGGGETKRNQPHPLENHSYHKRRRNILILLSPRHNLKRRLTRGFPIRWPRAGRTRLKVWMRCLSRTPSRLEVGDTAGWKPALPGNGRPADKAAFQA